MIRQTILNWGQRLVGVGLAQGAVQILALVSGLLVIRFLKPESYALYSLAYSVLGMMSVLADSGISSGGMAEAGKVWQDPGKLGQVVATVMNLRRRFALWVIVLSTPALLYLLHSHGAPWGLAVLLSVLVIIQFLVALQIAVYGLAPALHQWVGKTQRIAMVQNTARVASLALGMMAAPTALIAMLATLPAQFWNFLQIRKLSESLTHPSDRVDPEVRSRVLAVVRRIMPGAIYYALSGQITIWLISIFGSTDTLAQVGALGRLGQALTVISSVFTVIFLPRFARLQAEKMKLLARYAQVLGLALVIGLSVCGLVALYPRQTLWILGKNYAGLEHEVLLQAIVGVLSLLAGLAYHLGAVRSVVIKPTISIPLEILLQASVIKFFAFSTASGVLYFAMVTAGAQLLMHAGYFWYNTFIPNHENGHLHTSGSRTKMP
jgi:O-antigen/teichoic acid export membrane protein